MYVRMCVGNITGSQSHAQETFGLAVVAGAAPPQVHMKHFMAALDRVRPSVSPKDQRSYDRLRNKLAATRAHITDSGADGERSDCKPDLARDDEDGAMEA